MHNISKLILKTAVVNGNQTPEKPVEFPPPPLRGGNWKLETTFFAIFGNQNHLNVRREDSIESGRVGI